MEGKPVSASFITHQIIEVSPGDLNVHGTLFGGRLMQMIDHLAASVAKRHSEKMCVPVGIDSVRFKNSAKRGDVLICRAAVNRAWPNSMEVGVNVIAEDFRTLDHKEILSAYFTFIAVDEDHRPVEIIPVIPETPEQIARFVAAEKRRTVRDCAQKS